MLFDKNNPGATADFAQSTSIAGSVAAVVGAFASAQAQRDELAWQAEVAQINAAAAASSARTALQLGQRQVQAQQLRTGKVRDAQTAGFAANGVDIGFGSAARTRASTEIMGEIDANAIAADAVRQAFGYRSQGTNYRAQGVMLRSASGAVNPMMSAATTGLTSAGMVARQWYALNNR